MAIDGNSCIYFIFLGVTLVIGFAKDNHTPYLLNQSVTTAFAGSPARTGSSAHFGLMAVEKPADWWKFATTQFVDNAFWETWYNGQSTINEAGKAKYALGGSLVRIGPIILRQRRIIDVYCSTEIDQLQGPYDSCKPQWHWGADNNLSLWVDSLPEFAEVNADNNEVIVKLQDTRDAALTQLETLRQHDYITRETSQILFDLVLYHPASKMFIPVSMETELAGTGRARNSLRVEAVRLYRYMGTMDKVLLACELVFICIILLKVQLFITGLLRDKSRYFTHKPWHWVELLSIMASVTYVVMYILRFVFVYDVIDEMRASFYKEHVNLWFIVTWDEIIRSLIGLIQFLVFVESLKLLRYGNIFARYMRVYKRARREMGVFLYLAIILLVAYTSLSLGWFQPTRRAFMSLGRAMMTSCSMMVMKSRHAGLDVQESTYAKLFLATVIVFSMGLLLSYIAVVFIHYFRESKRDHQLTMSGTETMKYYWSQIKAVFTRETESEEGRTLEEEDNTLPAEFTMAEIEYQVDELLFKMNAIAGTHGLPEKAPCYFTDSDCTYSPNEDIVSSGGSDPNGAPYPGAQFPFPDLVDGAQKLDRRLQKIEKNLYEQEGNLSALLQLDLAGSEALGIDQENQLRSQLEMEIFRQLQIKRQNKHHVTDSANQNLPDERGDHKAGSLPDDNICSVSDNDNPTSQSPPLQQASSQSKLSHWSSRHSLQRRHRESPGNRLRPSLSESSLLEQNADELPDIPIHSLDDLSSGPHSTTEYVDFYDDFFDDSSTCSDVSMPRSSIKSQMHSLRKTKSRGKGKGRKSFFAPADALGEFTKKDTASGGTDQKQQPKPKTTKKKHRW